MSEYITTKLLKTVKAKLDKLRGAAGLSEYIETMLTFFEVTGARPGDFQTHPTISLKKDLDQLKAIVRAIEKDTLKPIYHSVQVLVDNGLLTTGRVGQELQAPEGDPIITDDMILRVADENTRLTELLQKEQRAVQELRNEIAQLQQADSSSGSDHNAEATELFLWLKGQMKKNQVTNDFVIPHNSYKLFAERLEKMKK